MPVDLYARDVADADIVLAAWLNGAASVTTSFAPSGRRTATSRKADDPLPSWMTNEVTATEDQYQSEAFPLVSVHVFGSSKAMVVSEAVLMHRRMGVLVYNSNTVVTLPDSSVAVVAWCEVVERPHWEFYADTILRKVGTYRLAVPFLKVS